MSSARACSTDFLLGSELRPFSPQVSQGFAKKGLLCTMVQLAMTSRLVIASWTIVQRSPFLAKPWLTWGEKGLSSLPSKKSVLQARADDIAGSHPSGS